MLDHKIIITTCYVYIIVKERDRVPDEYDLKYLHKNEKVQGLGVS